MRPYDFEDQLNCCEVRKVGIGGGDSGDDDENGEEEEEDKLRSEILLRYVAETKYDSLSSFESVTYYFDVELHL